MTMSETEKYERDMALVGAFEGVQASLLPSC